MEITAEKLFMPKAKFTVETKKGHITYRLKPKPGDGNAMFVSYNSNAQDERWSWPYVGMLTRKNGKLRFFLTQGSKVDRDSDQYGVFAVIVWALNAGMGSPDRWRLLNPTHCWACGRELTTPESIARGLGPECAKKR